MMTLPVQLYFSYEVPVYGCFLNLIVLPLMGVLMVTGLLVMLVPGTGILGTVTVAVLKLYEQGCKLADQMPGAVWNPGKPQMWQVLLSYLLIGIAIWAVPVCLHQWKLQICLLTASVMVLSIQSFCPGRDQVTFLDVGQGDCCIVEFESGEVFLFDCGSSSRTRVGERVLLPYLKMRGIHKIDAVFLSHGDSDHINGIEELLKFAGQERLRVGQIYLPDRSETIMKQEFGEFLFHVEQTAPDCLRRVRYIEAGDFYQSMDQTDGILCVAPGQTGGTLEGNEGSACFYIWFSEKRSDHPSSAAVAGWSLLLTGDVEKEGEQELVQRLADYNLCSVTLLKVAHHGSRYSSSQQFLDQVQPSCAVISAGRGNRYGHPHEETLERLESVGSRWLCTMDSGAMTIRRSKEDRFCLHTVKKFKEGLSGWNKN